MAWNDLSIAQKSQMMNFFRQRGVNSLSEMKQLYDSAYPSSGQSDWGGNVPPVFADGGPTKTFTQWKKAIKKYKNINTEDPDYDYEGFYNENPERAWQMLKDSPEAHFTDRYKTKSHPTLSNESIYAGGLGGTWGDSTFELSDYLMQNSDRTLDYLNQNDPDIIPTYKGGIVLKSSKVNAFAQGGKIHIKKSKRGTFTAAAKKHGMSVQAFARKVLANPDNYSPAMRKKANFARNASKWKAEGGELGILPILENALDNI